MNRGLSLKHLGDQYQDQALADFQEAIKLNPNDPRPYFNRGTIYCSKQDYEATHRDYDRAIELTSGIPEYSKFSTFHHAKGLAYSDQRDFESAKKCFQEAIMKNPVSVQSIFHLGLVEHELKELTKALEAFTEVINTNKAALADNEPKEHAKSQDDFNDDVNTIKKKEKKEDRLVNLILEGL